MNAPLLEARSLTVSIAGKHVCEKLDLALTSGECVGLIGSNGVGKTTLLRTLSGLRPADSGRVRLRGETAQTLGRRDWARGLGLLVQQHEDPFPASVLETVLIGRHPHIDFWGWESHRDVAIARRALKKMQLEGLEQRAVATLSGGERRRLGIATILAQDPDVFLLDEPTNHLDLHHQLAVLALFRAKAREEGRAVLMSLHDMNQAARFCDRVLLMFGAGETLLGETYKVLTIDNLRRLYGIPVRMITTTDTLFFQPE